MSQTACRFSPLPSDTLENAGRIRLLADGEIMTEHDELKAEVVELRSALDTLRTEFEAHTKNHALTPQQAQARDSLKALGQQ